MTPLPRTSTPSEDLVELVGLCEAKAAEASTHVTRFSRAHWVLSLSAAALTAVVGVTVFYDSLPDWAKAALAVAAVLANVAAGGVRAEDKMAGCRVERAGWKRLQIEVELLQQRQGEAVTPEEAAALKAKATTLEETKAVAAEK